MTIGPPPKFHGTRDILPGPPLPPLGAFGIADAMPRSVTPLGGPVGFQKSATYGEAAVSSCPFVLVDQTT